MELYRTSPRGIFQVLTFIIFNPPVKKKDKFFHLKHAGPGETKGGRGVGAEKLEGLSSLAHDARLSNTKRMPCSGRWHHRGHHLTASIRTFLKINGQIYPKITKIQAFVKTRKQSGIAIYETDNLHNWYGSNTTKCYTLQLCNYIFLPFFPVKWFHVTFYATNPSLHSIKTSIYTPIIVLQQ